MRNNRFHRISKYSIKDKDNALIKFTENILNKTAQIFEYRNLPDSIPQYILESMLQENGNVFWHEVEGVLYVFTGGLGGVPDVYYRPTEYIIANPALRYSKSCRVGIDGVLMRNDDSQQGLLPIIYKYGSMLLECDISLYNAVINTRDYNAFSAMDDKTIESARQYQAKIEAGETAVIAENQLLEGIRRHPTNPSNSTLTQLRETYQYIKSLLYSDLGMKVSHNMKSQYVSDEENIINDDTLIPLVDNMLSCRQEALKEINEMFGLDIQVKLRGTWELQQEEVTQNIEMVKGEIEDEEQESDIETIEEPIEEDKSDGEGETKIIDEDRDGGDKTDGEVEREDNSEEDVEREDNSEEDVEREDNSEDDIEREDNSEEDVEREDNSEEDVEREEVEKAESVIIEIINNINVKEDEQSEQEVD